MAKIDQYKKVKNTNLIFASIITVLIIAIVVVLLLPNGQQRIYKEYASEKGNTLPADHILKQTSAKKLVELSKKDKYIFVYYGNESCSNCAASIGQVDEEIRDAGLSVIYYINSSKLKKSDENYIQENIKDGLDLSTGTPQYWLIKNGEVILNSDDSSFIINDSEGSETIKLSYFLRTVKDALKGEE